MSLIEEALRRVQQTPEASEQHEVVVQPPQPVIRTSVERALSVDRRSWVAAALFGMGFVVVAGILLSTLWRFVIPARQTAVVASAPQAHQSPKAPAVVPSPKPLLLSSRPQLELNGVVEGAGEPLAIINGAILRVGETIDGATLVEVGTDTVRMRWRNQEWALTTAR